MINCPSCFNQLPDGARFCSACGTSVQAQPPNQPQQQPASGQAQVRQQQPAIPDQPLCAQQQMYGQAPAYAYQPPVNDSGSFGWAVLGFCLPVVGLILWLVWKDQKPLSAKQVSRGAIAGAIVFVVFTLLGVAVSLFAAYVAIDLASSYCM